MPSRAKKSNSPKKKVAKAPAKAPKRLNTNPDKDDKPSTSKDSSLKWDGRKIAKVFKKRAAENIAVIASSPFAVEEMDSETSFKDVKRGSFEISVTDEDGKSETIWSGFKLGPPRRLKFPEPDQLLKRLQTFLK